MQMEQMSLYDIEYEKYKINKPIRLIELFAGYGSQALALKYLGIPFEHWKTCEWAVKSIQAYKDIHFTNDNTDYSQEQYSKDLDLLRNTLFELGISSNYNEPMTREQINRLNEQQVRTIYNNIVATHNLVNIQQVKGEDLEIKETDKYDYILTYSFPCQDLSLAGKGKGMSDTSTRSGMLWEVERILQECKDLGNLPQVLLMENVPQVHGVDNVSDFNKWKRRLEELGYNNYFQDLIATDYGIPQTRNRCFMVSILGDYSYTFPKPIPLELRLKDMLEDNVDEKYYLSDKMMEYITSKDDKYKVNENKLVINRDIACSKTTREGNTRADTTDYICKDLPENCNIKNGCKQVYDLNYYNHEQSNKVYSPEYSSPTLRTQCDEAGTIKIINATAKGYLEAKDGDGIDISSRMEYHRGTVQKGKSQTITTSGGNDRGVCVYDFDSSEKFLKNGNRDLGEQEKFPTLLAKGPKYGIYKSDLRIRKLTPKECFRLMGVKDEDFDKVSKNQSDSSLYHLAGDSIVVNVLMAIFKKML